MRAIIGALVGLVAFAGVALALSPNAPLATFPTEAQAQQHCPGQTVVWLNLPTRTYHYKGQRCDSRWKPVRQSPIIVS